MPAMNAVGTKTAQSTSEMAMTGPVTSSSALNDASCGDSPCAIHRSTFSTTTIASSTTMPIASTRPNSDRLFSENPSMLMNMNAPMSETGTAIIGMIVARQFCRNTSTTMKTRTNASINVWNTLLIDSCTNTVVSY